MKRKIVRIFCILICILFGGKAFGDDEAHIIGCYTLMETMHRQYLDIQNQADYLIAQELFENAEILIEEAKNNLYLKKFSDPGPPECLYLYTDYTQKYDRMIADIPRVVKYKVKRCEVIEKVSRRFYGEANHRLYFDECIKEAIRRKNNLNAELKIYENDVITLPPIRCNGMDAPIVPKNIPPSPEDFLSVAACFIKMAGELLRSGEYEKALSDLEMALTIEPDENTDVHQEALKMMHRALTDASAAFFRQNDMSEALERRIKALSLQDRCSECRKYVAARIVDLFDAVMDIENSISDGGDIGENHRRTIIENVNTMKFLVYDWRRAPSENPAGTIGKSAKEIDLFPEKNDPNPFPQTFTHKKGLQKYLAKSFFDILAYDLFENPSEPLDALDPLIGYANADSSADSAYAKYAGVRLDAYYYRGVADFKKEDFQNAYRVFTGLEKMMPAYRQRMFPSYLCAVRIIRFAHEKQWDKAEKKMNEFCIDDPHLKETVYLAMYYLEGKYYVDARNWEKAVDALTPVAQRDTDYKDVELLYYLAIGHNYIEQESGGPRSLDRALAMFERIVRKNPEFNDNAGYLAYHYYNGVRMMSQHKRQQACEAFSKVAALDPDYQDIRKFIDECR